MYLFINLIATTNLMLLLIETLFLIVFSWIMLLLAHRKLEKGANNEFISLLLKGLFIKTALIISLFLIFKILYL